MKGSRLARIASDVVVETQRELPPEILEVARGVPVRFEPAPGPDLLAEGFEPDILGLFTGTPHGPPDPGGDPARIYLYTANLWDFAEGDEAAFRQEARLTYLHELGHFLGWDEDQLAARGLD
jgi:predicted Zn-dependent protease with MMP-like domain